MEIAEIMEKPSSLCGGCKLYEEQCHCKCHVMALMHGFHEIVWIEDRDIKIVHPEND